MVAFGRMYLNLADVPELRNLPHQERQRLFKKFRYKALASPWPWILGLPIWGLVFWLQAGEMLVVGLGSLLGGVGFRYGQLVAMRPMLRRELGGPTEGTDKNNRRKKKSRGET